MTFSEFTAHAQREYLTRVLRRNAWNLTAAAREAGRDRSNFKRLCRRLGVEWTSPHVHLTPNMPGGDA